MASTPLAKMLRKTWDFVLETIAPQDPYVRSIELMSPAEFSAKASEILPEGTIDGVISFFSYKGKLAKTAILEVKSYGNKRIARLLGTAIRDLLVFELSELELFENFTKPLLVPIPLTKKSLRRRGYNQCELIAREIAKADKGATLEMSASALIKTKETGDQVGKSRVERFANLKGCFQAKSEETKGRNVIVLDDIVTTGATLKEAERALRKAGARKIILVSVAH